jgi:hypothetical protein
MKTYEKHCVDFFRKVQDFMEVIKKRPETVGKARILYLLNGACEETALKIARDTIAENKEGND